MVYRGSVSETWATILAGAGNTVADSGTVIYGANFGATATSSEFGRNIRSILLFDSSGLPDTVVISAAVLSIYGFTVQDELSATPDSNIYASTPASNTALAITDYGQTQDVAFATAITYAAFNAAGYNDFTLNASGIAAISKTDVSKFSWKNANYDVAASQPPWVSGLYSWMAGYPSEQGDGFKPKLVVTYSTWQSRPPGVSPSGGGFMMF